MSQSKHSKWVFTINNYSIIDEAAIQNSYERAAIKYVGYARETGEEKQTKHLQGVTLTQYAMTLPQIKATIGLNAHVEPMKGSWAQQWSYIFGEPQYEKDGKIKPIPNKADCVELGPRPVDKRKEKTDWAEVQSLSKEGKFQELEEKYPRVDIMYGDQIRKKYRVDTIAKPTLHVTNNLPTKPYYIKDPTTKWWDGYRGEDHVVILYNGEEDKEAVNKLIKKLSNPLPVPVEIKCGSMQIKPTKITVYDATGSFYFV